MPTYFKPPQCTEREVGGWEDCVWCTGVMLANALLGRAKYPSTRAEYEALRVAGGDGPAENPGDGSSQAQQRTGMINRYGIAGTLLPVGTTWSTFRSKLVPGTAASITGRMGVWPSGSHWRRWDDQFTGGHDVFILVDDDPYGPWWMNPQAPNSYQGERIPWAELQKFYTGFNGGGHYGPAVQIPDQPTTPPDGGSPMAKFTAADIPSGTWLYTYHDYRADANNIKVDPGRPMIVSRMYSDGSLQVVHDNSGRTMYAKPGLNTIPLITPDECPPSQPGEPIPAPPTAESCQPYVDAALAGVPQQIKDAVAAEYVRVTTGTDLDVDSNGKIVANFPPAP